MTLSGGFKGGTRGAVAPSPLKFKGIQKTSCIDAKMPKNTLILTLSDIFTLYKKKVSYTFLEAAPTTPPALIVHILIAPFYNPSYVL